MQDLQLRKISETEYSSMFGLFKQYFQAMIEGAFGWDESFQKSRFIEKLDPSWFYWVCTKDSVIGLVCYKTTNESLHLHLLIVFYEVQRQGLGSVLAKKMQKIAVSKKLSLTLNCFKNNQPAFGLYQKLGFKVSSEDEYFYELISE